VLAAQFTLRSSSLSAIGAAQITTFLPEITANVATRGEDTESNDT